jgi:hypothetical protein
VGGRLSERWRQGRVPWSDRVGMTSLIGGTRLVNTVLSQALHWAGCFSSASTPPCPSALICLELSHLGTDDASDAILLHPMPVAPKPGPTEKKRKGGRENERRRASE